eukprot:SAG25_NODE_13410_length_267_cov_0.922619_2_plen_40_part_01
MYDTAWHTAPQPLEAWFDQYAARRYCGHASSSAVAAWKLL